LSCGEAATASVGSWQIAVSTPNDVYVAGVSAEHRPLDSNEVSLLPGDRIEIAVAASEKPASLKGTATNQDGRPAIGSMVFLRAADAGVERRLFGGGFTGTGQDGAFEFKGLAPGRYLVAASFDIQSADDIDWNDSSVKRVELEEGKQATLALGR
jgi:protocatechuate 3,4-dioxygenase beta subunit